MANIRPTHQEKSKQKAVYQEHYHPQFISLTVEQAKLTAHLNDGRELSIPRSWFKRLFLQEVEPQQLTKYEICPLGWTVYFPNLDEFLHVRTFTDGLKARCCC